MASFHSSGNFDSFIIFVNGPAITSDPCFRCSRVSPSVPELFWAYYLPKICATMVPTLSKAVFIIFPFSAKP